MGASAETDRDWHDTIERVLSFAPPHVSAYALTVEPGTPLARTPERHPDDDTQARRYEMLDQRLAASGYEWYEISNFSRPGHECRHNELCWAQADYLGFRLRCPQPCGRPSIRERMEHRAIPRTDPIRPLARRGSEVLGPDERRLESLELALRTRFGVPLDAFSEATVAELDGLIEQVADRFVLTRRGRMLANEATMRTLDRQ